MKKNYLNTIIISMIFIIIFFSIICSWLNLFKDMNIYIIQPTLYLLGTIIILVFGEKKYRISKKYAKDITSIVFTSVVIYSIIYFFSGFVVSFGYNATNRTIPYFILNLWAFVGIIFCKEFIRYFLINNLKTKNILKFGLFISILFTLPYLTNLFEIRNFQDFILVLLDDFLPQLVISVFLTYVSYYGHYYSAFIYSGVYALLLLITPIIPKIDPLLVSIISMLVPLITFLYINSNIIKSKRNQKKEKKLSKTFYIIYFSLLSFCILIGLNVLPIYPVVIATNSMYPFINVGDIVILEKIEYDELKVGDIIEYSMDTYGIVHRIEKIKANGDLITKGDNNQSIDVFAVKEKQVSGRYLTKIPYIGKLTLYVYDFFGLTSKDEVKVEMGDDK